MTGEAVPLAFFTLIRRNRRRYGGYTIHFGMAVLFIGVAASSAFQHVHTVELKKGQTVEIGRGYTARYDGPDVAHRRQVRRRRAARVRREADGDEGQEGRRAPRARSAATTRSRARRSPARSASYFDGEST